MVPLKHKWYISALKCILSVIWLALFTAQLSYKSYQYSGFSPYPSKEVISSHVLSGGEHVLSAFHRTAKVFLSPDRRYDLRQFFTILHPSFRIDHLVVQSKKEAYILSLRIILKAPLSLSLRGPPLV